MPSPDPPVAPASRRFPTPLAMDLGSNTIETVLQSVAELAVQTCDAARAASVTLLMGDHPSTFVSTGEPATSLDEMQYAQGFGPCLDAVLAGDVIMMLDARTERRWPEFTPEAIRRGALSSLSLPIPVSDSLSASLNVYADEPAAFSESDQTGIGGLVGFAGAAIANMHLYEASRTLVDQMRQATESRAVIDQARGILMAQHGCSAEEAFAILRRTSQQANRKIREIAEELVRQTAQ